VKNFDLLEKISGLLGTDPYQIEKAMVTKVLKIGKEITESCVKREKCIESRDALAKDLYNNCFCWLVKRMNYTTVPAEDLEPGADLEILAEQRLAIGLLDIFGFECF